MDSPKIKNEWTVTEEFNKQRIDYWLKKKISFLPYPSICKFIRKGIVRVNGKRIKNSFIIKTGDMIKFSRLIEENNISDEKKNLKNKFYKFIHSLVLYKNKYSILLNKPSGLAVQGGTNIKLNVDMMLDSLKFGLSERPKLVHRIDKQTSGLLLIARNLISSKFYCELFKNRLMDKKYLAIVCGDIKNNCGKIILSIGKQEKKLQSLTYFKVLDQKNDLSLLIIKPITGRKHQIRTHLNFIGNPILGETKYKEKFPSHYKIKNRLFLHAFLLNFKDINGEIKSYSAPIPNHFKDLMNKFNFDNSLKKYNLDFIDLENYKLIE